MIKLATKPEKCKDLESQLIINEAGLILGVNLICNNKILIKKRFDVAITLNNKIEEQQLINKVIVNAFFK